MKAEKLNVFITSVSMFFEQIGESLTQIDTPYLNDNDNPLAYDYTGFINIVGAMQGLVYVSAQSALLRKLLRSLGENEGSIVLLKDLIGEIANTVSGNARTEFGSDFIISPPTVVEGVPPPTQLPKDKRSYIIPFYWAGNKGMIGICVY